MPPRTTTKAPFRLVIIATAASCAGINIAFAIWALITRPSFNSDFRGPWSFANFAAHQPVVQIYQAAALQAYQRQLYPGFHSFFPYQYPPSFLLPIWWMGDFSYPAAQAIWALTGVVALVGAGWVCFEAPLRWFAILALLGSPASLLNGAAGETAYFTSALLIFGFAVLPTRPVLAGIAFGLLTLKPQLGVLIPFALLARAEYRAILAASLTALGLIALSCAVFPASLWLSWLHALPVYQTQYFAAGTALDLDTIVTVAGNLIRLGASTNTAWTLQLLSSAGTVAVVFVAFRHASYRLAVAAVFAGTFLCAPHAYAYDTLPLIAAMLLLNPASIAIVTLCLVTYIAPYLLLTQASHWFFYAFPEALLFIAIIRLAFSPTQSPNCPHEPVHQPTLHLNPP